MWVEIRGDWAGWQRSRSMQGMDEYRNESNEISEKSTEAERERKPDLNE